MSTAELKSNIHTLIDKTNDSDMLNIIYTILSGLKKQKKATIKLTVAEKKAVDEALDSIKRREKLISALEKGGSGKSISNPVKWQKENRKDRTITRHN